MLPSLGVGVRIEGGGGKTRKELILNYFTFTYDALCPSQKKAKGQRAAGYIIYFHLNMEIKCHTPFPFSGGVYLNQQPLLHPPCVCVQTHKHHSWEGDWADLVLLPITHLKRYDKGAKGWSHTRQV